MKKHSAFLRLPGSNISDNISRIISRTITPKKKRKPQKAKSFVIVNTDVNYGLYARELNKILKKYSLEQQFNNKRLTQLRSGDVIVFGTSRKFDFRVETNVNNFENYDEKDFKVYQLVEEFEKVIKRIQDYINKNYAAFEIDEDDDDYICPILRRPKRVQKSNTLQSIVRNLPSNKVNSYNFFNKLRNKYYVEEPDEVIVEVKVVEEREPKLKRYANKKRVSFCSDEGLEKATVHENWVKIGYDQYDISLDQDDFEYIKLEDGTKLYIVEDRFGRRKLQV